MGCKKCIAMVLAIAIMMLTLAGCGESNKEGAASSSAAPSGLGGIASSMTMIGVSMSGVKADGDDGEVMSNALQSAGYTVELAYAEDSSDAQSSQLAAMVQDGASALIVQPVDAASVSAVLKGIDVSNVIVLAYGEPVQGKSVNYYLGCNWQEIGRQQAQQALDALEVDKQEEAVTLEMIGGSDAGSALALKGALEVLQPYMDEGKVNILSGNVTADDCAAEDIDSFVETLLTDHYEEQELNALLCFGEGQSVDVIHALMDSYRGNVFPVVTGTGYNEEIDAMLQQYLLRVTMYAPKEELTQKALSLIQAAVTGGPQDQESVLTPPVALDRDNLSDYLVDGKIVIPETDGNAADSAAK